MMNMSIIGRSTYVFTECGTLSVGLWNGVADGYEGYFLRAVSMRFTKSANSVLISVNVLVHISRVRFG